MAAQQRQRFFGGSRLASDQGGTFAILSYEE